MPGTSKAQKRAAREKWRESYCRAHRKKAQQEHGPCAQCGGDNTCPPEKPECILSPWRPNCCPKKDGVRQTPHHIVPKHCFVDESGERQKGYSANLAPCICVTGSSKKKKHGKIHRDFDPIENGFRDEAKGVHNQKGVWSYGEARDAGVQCTSKHTGCPTACLESQLNKKHGQMGITDNTRLRADSTGKKVKALPTQMVEGDDV